MGLSTSARAPLQRQPVARPPRPPHPTPHGAVTSRTVNKGEVVPAAHRWAWVKRPEPLPDGRPGWHNAILIIDSVAYDAEASFCTDGDSGHHWLIVDLHKPDGTHYRVCLGPQDSCDCPHATYRSLVCKHLVSVRSALDWIEQQERDEWELMRAASALGAA